jgi:hypothetical protein
VLKKSKKLNMKNIIKAIADFQQDCPVILKDTSGYGYKYADLTQIDSVIKPLLKKHGLMYIQPLQNGSILTQVYHIDSGEMIESLCTIPFESIRYDPVIIETTKNGVTDKKTKHIIAGFEGMNTAQAYGSLITYFRRYTISSLLGLITDKDTDGTGEKQPETTQPQKQPAPPKPQPAPLTPEQQQLMNEYNELKPQITAEITACKDSVDLQIIVDSYPQFAKIGSFKKMLTEKHESFK